MARTFNLVHFFLLFPLFASLTVHAFDLWGDDNSTYLGQGWGGGLFVFSLYLDIIAAGLATRAIIQGLLRAAGGSGASESSAAQPTSHPVAPAAPVAPAQIQPKEQTRQLNQRLMVTFIGTVAVLATSVLLVFFLYAKPTTPQSVEPPTACHAGNRHCAARNNRTNRAKHGLATEVSRA